jgi:hypothetical protein
MTSAPRRIGVRLCFTLTSRHFILHGLTAPNPVLNDHVTPDRNDAGLSQPFSQDVFLTVCRIKQDDDPFPRHSAFDILDNIRVR